MELIERLLESGKEEQLEDAYDLIVQMEDKSKAIEYSKQLRGKCRGIQSERALELFYKTYLFNAQQGQFDDYMIYLEKDREPSKRFYLPRRKVLKPVVDAIQDLLDDKLDLLTISLPPGVGKTTIEVFLLSYVIGLYPDKPNLVSGHSGSLTKSIYDGVLGVVTDNEYLWNEVFPYAGEYFTNSLEQTLDIGKKHRFSSLTCCPINGSLTGRTRCEGFLCADDLCSGIEEAMNNERLEKLWQTYNTDLKSRKKTGCKEIHIATRWSVRDVIGRLQQSYGDSDRAKFISLSAMNENDESNFDYDYGVGFTTEYFRDMRDSLNASDPISWKALFMNEPIEREGLLYHEDDLRRYYELPSDTPDYVIGVCDTSNGRGDDTVLPIGYGYGDDWYIEDMVCDDGLPETTDRLCAEMICTHKPKMVQFESNNAGSRVADNVEKLIKQQGCQSSILKKHTQANKETKIFINSAWVKAHCLFKDKTMYKKGSTYDKFMSKLCSYTCKGKNAHDDVPDAMAQFSDFAQSMSGKQIHFYKRPF